MKKIIFRFFINLLWLILFIPNLHGASQGVDWSYIGFMGENKTKPICVNKRKEERFGYSADAIILSHTDQDPDYIKKNCTAINLFEILQKARKLLLILEEAPIEDLLNDAGTITGGTDRYVNNELVSKRPTRANAIREIKTLKRVYDNHKRYGQTGEPLEYYIELIYRALPENLKRKYLNSIFPPRVTPKSEVKREAKRYSTIIIIISVVSSALIFIFAIKNRNERIRLNIELEKEKRRREDLLKEKERKERNIRIKLEKTIPEKVSSLKSKSASILKKLRQSFYEVTKNVTEEEKDLLDLKNRHPKIESIVTSRKIGDSHSDQIKKIHEILGKLELE